VYLTLSESSNLAKAQTSFIKQFGMPGHSLFKKQLPTRLRSLLMMIRPAIVYSYPGTTPTATDLTNAVNSGISWVQLPVGIQFNDSTCDLSGRKIMRFDYRGNSGDLCQVIVRLDVDTSTVEAPLGNLSDDAVKASPELKKVIISFVTGFVRKID
jgi:hypothetical protein